MGVANLPGYRTQCRPQVVAVLEKGLQPAKDFTGIVQDHTDTLVAYIANVKKAMGPAPRIMTNGELRSAALGAVLAHKHKIKSEIFHIDLSVPAADATAAKCFSTVADTFSDFRKAATAEVSAPKASTDTATQHFSTAPLVGAATPPTKPPAEKTAPVAAPPPPPAQEVAHSADNAPVAAANVPPNPAQETKPAAAATDLIPSGDRPSFASLKLEDAQRYGDHSASEHYDPVARMAAENSLRTGGRPNSETIFGTKPGAPGAGV
jgi:hypothetical protein